MQSASENYEFRTSATAGNGIGVSQLTHAGKEIGKKLKLKPDTVADAAPHLTDAAPHLSDEDDSAERTSILQSPEKGPKRLSSAVSCSYFYLRHLITLAPGHH